MIFFKYLASVRIKLHLEGKNIVCVDLTAFTHCMHTSLKEINKQMAIVSAWISYSFTIIIGTKLF